ncbi:MAG: hypothetical protein Q7K54_01975 [Candidatus Parcubacteria bacterium]|nr:hypothetical protein [Candidatus Parcubacteria bacterium]
MKELKINKKVTINDLAIMVAKGFESTATKDDIKNIDEKLDKHDKIFHSIMRELKAMHEDRKYFRGTISSLNSDGLSYNRKIENLTIRVEKLESNPK